VSSVDGWSFEYYIHDKFHPLKRIGRKKKSSHILITPGLVAITAICRVTYGGFNMKQFLTALFLALGVPLFISCSPISSALQAEAGKAPPFTEILKAPGQYTGTTVIWGGVIVEISNRQDGTYLIVINADLDSGQRPGEKDLSKGRFIAFHKEFLDPSVYKEGREITVAGKITGSEELPIGEMRYRYPVVTVEEIHLWEEPKAYYDPYFYDPWYFWPYPYWRYPYAYPYPYPYYPRHYR